MPCGPVTAGGNGRTDEGMSDPFSYGHATALMQGWANMTILWSAPLRAALIVAGEAVRQPEEGGK